MNTILITAYAVNPYKGSEDGTGWNISRELSVNNKVYVVTRRNNRGEIERYMNEKGSESFDNMNFLYYDLPKVMMFWKKMIGERGYVLYYYLWQLFMPIFIKYNKVSFDIVHVLNFHSDSHPQFMWIFGKPVFWGPIGHHPIVPYKFIRPTYKLKNLIKDRLYNIVKFMMRNCDPFFHISKWTSKKIFVINSGINDHIRANPNKIAILPAVANNREQIKLTRNNEFFTILAVGRFVYMKGFDVTIRAFAKFYHQLNSNEKKKVKLKLVGKGEELSTIEDIIKEEKIGEVTEIIKWVKKNEMANIYQSSSVFVFGSHEGAGMVVPEALSFGLPVICFDNYGPGELCTEDNSFKIPYQSYEKSIADFSDKINILYHSPKIYSVKSLNAISYASQKFTWKSKREIIEEAYLEYFQTNSKPAQNSINSSI